MGFIAKRLIKQDLNLVDVLIQDTQNEYFNVVEMPTTFTQGRSAFKIFGSEFLKSLGRIDEHPNKIFNIKKKKTNLTSIQFSS